MICLKIDMESIMEECSVKDWNSRNRILQINESKIDMLITS